MAKVKVGCKLPHGIICELGVTIDEKSNVKRETNYQAVKLNGTNQTLVAGAPATANQPAGITVVEEAFIKEWLKQNAKLGFVKAGMIYLIANDAEGAAIAIDQSKMRTGFEPLNKSDVPKDSEGKPMIQRDEEAGSKG